MKAIPTEYSGVTFRSKTEAVFARNLDLCVETLWEYEPGRLKVDDWIPDFLVYRKSRQNGLITTYIIELKPSVPTDTYKEALRQRFLSEKLYPYEGTLVIGSPFDNCIPRTVEYADSSGWIPSTTPPEHHFCFAYWGQSISYRFDLKQQFA